MVWSPGLRTTVFLMPRGPSTAVLTPNRQMRWREKGEGGDGSEGGTMVGTSASRICAAYITTPNLADCVVGGFTKGRADVVGKYAALGGGDAEDLVADAALVEPHHVAVDL